MSTFMWLDYSEREQNPSCQMNNGSDLFGCSGGIFSDNTPERKF